MSEIPQQFGTELGQTPQCPVLTAQLSPPLTAIPICFRVHQPCVWIIPVLLFWPCWECLEITARSVLNAKQPVSKGLVLIWAKLETQGWINVSVAPSTEGEGGCEGSWCTCTWCCRFLCMQPRRGRASSSAGVVPKDPSNQP